MTALALAALLFAAPDGPVPCLDLDRTSPPPVLAAAGEDEALRAFWQKGVPFADFLADATRRAKLWERNYEDGAVPAEVVARARAVGGTWYLLAVAVDACSDSVNTIPYLALLTEAVPGLDMRIVDPRDGRALMEARRTPDGRAATPTVVLLDADFDDAGCFVERPRPLKGWIAENETEMSTPELYEGKMAWYAEDSGASTLAEVVSLLESAAAGTPRCEP